MIQIKVLKQLKERHIKYRVTKIKAAHILSFKNHINKKTKKWCLNYSIYTPRIRCPSNIFFKYKDEQ